MVILACKKAHAQVPDCVAPNKHGTPSFDAEVAPLVRDLLKHRDNQFKPLSKVLIARQVKKCIQYTNNVGFSQWGDVKDLPDDIPEFTEIIKISRELANWSQCGVIRCSHLSWMGFSS